jgi:hypothetical protein
VSVLRHHLLVVLAVALLVSGGAGVAVAQAPPTLSAHGPTDVSGTAASAVFRIAHRTIRQVRYRDRGTLVYSFVLRNDGSLPVTVTGLSPLASEPRLFHPLALTDADGAARFTVPAGGWVPVRVRLRMRGCETLSARAGSFVTRLAVRTTWLGMLHRDVRVLLPEQVHTGSPREAFCPRSTATSRPPG